MGLMVTFVSGPRRSGKSSVIQSLVHHECRHPPHYIRLAVRGGDKRPPQVAGPPKDPCGVASARWLDYEEDEVFEVLPAALETMYRQDRYGTVFIEGDSDPHLRHAYPYDKRLFVMPPPRDLHEVFRTHEEAAGALKHVLDDTLAFASEIYGLFDPAGRSDGEVREPRPPMTLSQFRGLFNSPLGEELATRIQFQPSYHGLVESDVVLLNTGIGKSSSAVEPCVRRIEQILARTRRLPNRQCDLFRCDPLDPKDAHHKALFRALAPMCKRKKYT